MNMNIYNTIVDYIIIFLTLTASAFSILTDDEQIQYMEEKKKMGAEIIYSYV